MGRVRNFFTGIYQAIWQDAFMPMDDITADGSRLEGLGHGTMDFLSPTGNQFGGYTGGMGQGFANPGMYALDRSAESGTPWWEPEGSSYGGVAHRFTRYMEADYLDTIPEVHSSCDTYADEATSVDENGSCIIIQSSNSFVVKECRKLERRLGLNDRAWQISRDLCKYGDHFLELIFDPRRPERGIQKIKVLPVKSMWRIETLSGRLLEFQQSITGPDYMGIMTRHGPNNSKHVLPLSVKGSTIVFSPEMVVHTRIGGDGSIYYPYGTSILATARRAAHQLKLMEDAMLVYRLVRAPERRIFYIDVGNTPPNKVEAFVERVKDRMKKRKIYNSQTGQIDERYNPLPIRRTTPVPLLDGRTLTIEEIAREYEAGKTNWVYSCQDGTGGRIVPGKIAWCGKNYTCSNMKRIWFDDGGHVDLAPEHPFLMRDGTKKRADEIEPGDSVMPLYTRVSSKQDGMQIAGYPMFLDNASEEWEFTHRRVGNDALREQREEVRSSTDWTRNKNLVIHHRDFNHLNADPTNLSWMGSADHFDYHASIGRSHFSKYNRSEAKRKQTSELNRKYKTAEHMSAIYNGSALHKQHNENRRQGQHASWSNPTEKARRSENMRWIIPNEVMHFVFEQVKANPKIKRVELSNRVRKNTELVALIAQSNIDSKRKADNFYAGVIIDKLVRMGCLKKCSYNEFRRYAAKNRAPLNHQVIRVENIADVDDVYCMTVLGPKGEENRHNFAIKTLNSLGEQNESKLFVINSVDEDFFLPVRGQQTGTRIDTLPGACLSLNTNINLLDGRTVTLEEAIKEFEAGVTNWVHSCNPETGEVVPGLISWAGVTRKNAEVMKIMLSDGKTLIVTPDHKFPVIGKGKIKAEDLKVGEVLIPFNKESADRSLWPEKKVIFVTKHDEVMNVGTLTIDADEQYHNYHTFAIEGSIFTCNSNLDQLGDVEYFRRKLYVALKIPPGYLEQDITAANNRLTLSSQDVRFAKTIYRVQKSIATSFRDIFLRHLMLIGVPLEQLDDLNVMLVAASPWHEISQAEVIDARINRANSIKSSMIYSLYDILTMILKHPHQEALNIIKRKREDDIDAARIEAYKAALATETQIAMNNPPQGIKTPRATLPSQQVELGDISTGGENPLEPQAQEFEPSQEVSDEEGQEQETVEAQPTLGLSYFDTQLNLEG